MHWSRTYGLDRIAETVENRTHTALEVRRQDVIKLPSAREHEQETTYQRIEGHVHYKSQGSGDRLTTAEHEKRVQS